MPPSGRCVHSTCFLLQYSVVWLTYSCLFTYSVGRWAVVYRGRSVDRDHDHSRAQEGRAPRQVRARRLQGRCFLTALGIIHPESSARLAMHVLAIARKVDCQAQKLTKIARFHSNLTLIHTELRRRERRKQHNKQNRDEGKELITLQRGPKHIANPSPSTPSAEISIVVHIHVAERLHRLQIIIIVVIVVVLVIVVAVDVPEAALP